MGPLVFFINAKIKVAVSVDKQLALGQGALDSDVFLGYPRRSSDRASTPRTCGEELWECFGQTPMALTPICQQKQRNLHAYTLVIKTMYQILNHGIGMVNSSFYRMSNYLLFSNGGIKLIFISSK